MNVPTVLNRPVQRECALRCLQAGPRPRYISYIESHARCQLSGNDLNGTDLGHSSVPHEQVLLHKSGIFLFAHPISLRSLKELFRKFSQGAERRILFFEDLALPASGMTAGFAWFHSLFHEHTLHFFFSILRVCSSCIGNNTKTVDPSADYSFQNLLQEVWFHTWSTIVPASLTALSFEPLGFQRATGQKQNALSVSSAQDLPFANARCFHGDTRGTLSQSAVPSPVWGNPRLAWLTCSGYTQDERARSVPFAHLILCL
jgi:hypothetical protein